MAENPAISGMVDVLRPFLHPREKVFLCSFENSRCAAFCAAAEAVRQLEAECVCWSGQKNWQSLLRQIFFQRPTALIGSSRLILGLAKIARITGTPLTVRHVVLLGNEDAPWMIRGIQDSLDVQIHRAASGIQAPCSAPQRDPQLQELEAHLLSWSSVLDFRAERTAQGLRMEILVFPGRKLPQLPSGACITVRDWNPKLDAPFCLCDS